MTRPNATAEHLTLLLMRHGKSDWNAGAADDASRPLNRRGEKAGALMGKWLRKQRLAPDYILASTAVRTRETARIVAGITGCPADRLLLDERLYHAGVEQHLEVLRAAPAQSGILMLVGHNPGLEELLEALCMEPPTIPADGKLLPTAAIAELRVPAPLLTLQPGQARLLQLVRPRDLAG